MLQQLKARLSNKPIVVVIHASDTKAAQITSS